MEWVETTGKTVEEAKARALDQLGVAEDDAEFDVLEEPRPGLFGRMRGEARVRARVRPTQPRPKVERRDRKKRSESTAAAGVVAGRTAAASIDDATPPRGESSMATTISTETPAHGAADSDEQLDAGVDQDDVRASETQSRSSRRRRGGRGRGGSGSRPASPAGTTGDSPAEHGPAVAGAVAAGSQEGSAPRRPRNERRDGAAPGTGDGLDMVDAQQVGDEARTFVQNLVDAFGLNGTAELRRDGDDLEVAVEGSDLGLLVGPRGATLQAIQELTRVAAQRRLGDHDTRLRVDVGGYRVRRREALARFANEQAALVVSEGRARILEPMSSADRKVIHDTLLEFEGVETRSEGDDPNRRVVIAPTSA